MGPLILDWYVYNGVQLHCPVKDEVRVPQELAGDRNLPKMSYWGDGDIERGTHQVGLSRLEDFLGLLARSDETDAGDRDASVGLQARAELLREGDLLR